MQVNIGNGTKVIALAIVAGVAKSLFQDPRPPAVHNHYTTPEPERSLASVPNNEDNA